jgi:acetate kinase
MEVLCLDGGSSSLKYAAYRTDAGQLARSAAGTEVATADAEAGLATVLSKTKPYFSGAIGAVGHRIVFGGLQYEAPVLAGDAVLADLETLVAIEPLHLRSELDLVYAAKRQLPDAPHVLCFDTAFHRQSPAIARRLPLPENIDPLLQRYGFHGLSYEYIASELGPGAGLTVAAHLGSGASLCALDCGRPIDTTMGFSALGGLMMGTRPGDLDPGVILRLLEADGYDASRLSNLLYRESGLLGVSGTTADMQTLVSAADCDARAAGAVELFIYQLHKQLGAMIAVLGGLQTLVFTGGIGEHAPTIRRAACERLTYLGVRLNAAANERNARIISTAQSEVEVLVIPTDENLMIARHTLQLLERETATHQ